ncbi:MAG: TIM barrel protein [Cyclobacteriaceae bacterium]
MKSRRSAIKTMLLTGAAAMTGGSLQARMAQNAKVLGKMNGNINHSVCKWCYKDIPLEDLCKSAEEIGLNSIELLGPKDWPMLQKYGLKCAMGTAGGINIPKGFNDPQYHENLIKTYSDIIPIAAKAGVENIICFSGNRNGMDDELGMENSAKGLKKLMSLAEKHKVTIVMELLNSKVNHKDYMCDHTAWGAALADKIGSERFKLLYDIYHMQIMEGDVIATIKQYNQYFAHYHTGGVPGRNEIDDTQELNYKPIMKAIVDTGFKGHVAQEFIPKREDKLKSLKQGVDICDV